VESKKWIDWIDKELRDHGYDALWEYKYRFLKKLDHLFEFRWKLYYRFLPSHQYHIVRLGLKPDYYETDTRLFYAIFRIFEEHLNEAKEIVIGYDYVVGDNPDFDAYLTSLIDEDKVLKNDDTIDYLKRNRKVFEDFHEAWDYWLRIGKDYEEYENHLCGAVAGTPRNLVKRYRLSEKLNKEKVAMCLKIIRHLNFMWC